MIARYVSILCLAVQAGAAQAASIGVSKALEPTTFQKVIWHYVDDAAAKAGISTTSSIAKGDPQLQIDQIAAFYAAGVDGVVATMDSAKLADTLVTNARKAKKPLVFVNTAPPANLLGDGVTFVGSDEIEAGTLQMTEVCSQMNGKGTVAILMGDLSHAGARGRTTAEHAVLRSPACHGIELLEEQSAGWSKPQAQEVVRSWLNAGVKPDAIVANNDDMALGAVEALKAAGIKGTIVAGVDATDDALKAMQAGDMSVTVLQDAQQQGETAVLTAKRMIAGEKLPNTVMIPFRLITRDQAATLMRNRTGG